MANYNLCIVKPNKAGYSETFIQEHINKLAGNKKVVYGGAFPVYNHLGQFLISSKLGLLIYLFQKRILKRLQIRVRDMAFVRYLKKEKIDVVLAEYGFTGAMIAQACKQANVPLLIHFHGADAHHHETVNRYLPLYPSAFNYAGAIVAVSVDMVEKLKKLGAPAEKIALIPYGVDLEKFAPVTISAAKHFLSVGRFVDKKSPQSVVKAFKQVADLYPDAKLWMVGSGPLFNVVVELVKELQLSDQVILTGVLDQAGIYKLMQQTRCFVQHSVTAANGDMEGTPNTILEAAASGLPIVSTRHAGIKQAVLDGISGYLVEENDIDGMAKWMIKVASASLTDLQAMGEAGKAHIRENYAISKQIPKLDQLLKQLI